MQYISLQLYGVQSVPLKTLLLLHWLTEYKIFEEGTYAKEAIEVVTTTKLEIEALKMT